MKQHFSLLAGLLMMSASGAQCLPGSDTTGHPSSHKSDPPAHPSQKSLVRHPERLPLSFESNQGQTDSQVRFLSHVNADTLFLTPKEAVFSVVTPSDRQATATPHKNRKGRCEAEKITRAALRMQILGADPRAAAIRQQPLPGRVNYFMGHDPRAWHTDIPTYGKVGFQGIYPGVDVVYYGNRQHLEYDFVVAPHADPKQINLRFAGARSVRIDASGDLVVRVGDAELKWRKPEVYQQDARGRQGIPAQFQLKRLPKGETSVRFAVGRYDAARPLVIDPVLLYSTFLGGTPTGASGDVANGIAVDSAGNAYVAGMAVSPDFPSTAGAFQTFHPKVFAFITKLNPTGTGLVYSTFLGGDADVQYANAIAVNSSGEAYVVGNTFAPNFPVTPGALKTVWTSGTGASAFVTKLNTSGSALVYSTLLGGSTSDSASSVAVDSNGDAFVTGKTASPDFPTTPGAFQTVYKSKGSGNAFVTKLNPAGSAALYSTYLGGTGTNPGDPPSNGDASMGIAIDSAGNAYVTGYTSSTDFPVTNAASYKRTTGTSDTIGFVTELDPTGTRAVYSTYLGILTNAGRNIPRGIALDSNGIAYITGYTGYGGLFLTDLFSYQQYRHTEVTGYFAKVDHTGFLLYSTYLGGSGDSSNSQNGDQPTAIAVDSAGNAYITGSTGSSDFPIKVGGIQSSKSSATYAVGFVTKINAAGTALPYSTYLGGRAQSTSSTLAYSSPVAIALDSSGNVYVAGTTNSSDFPTTPGAFQTVNHGANTTSNAFVTKLSPIPIYPDFNSDGSTDLLLQNPSTGAISTWFMQGANKVGSAAFSLSPPTEYTLVGAGDFTRSGATSLVMQSMIDHRIVFWYTGGANNATITGGDFVNVTPLADQKLVAVGDFNGDGQSELVFQNQSTNAINLWYMNGPNVLSSFTLLTTPAAGWKLVGTGDLDGDGFTDLVFQNQTTGQIVFWFMTTQYFLHGAVLPNVPEAGWKVVGVGDYNGDGYADLLFQNQTTHQAVIWYLRNGVYAGGSLLSSSLPNGTNIVGPH